jgi:hypothetical protein
MNHYIIYFINGGYKYISTSVDIMQNLNKLHLLDINYDIVDYIVSLENYIDESVLQHKKYLPDGSSVWKKESLINKKIEDILVKRNSLLQKLYIDFIRSLETPNSRDTEIVKNNKRFLRDLSCRTELHHIHDCEKILKFNAFFNIVDIQILDPGYGCSQKIPTVTISPPEETEYNFGFTACANAIVGSKGELKSLTVQKHGSGYISDPQVKITGYESENAKHPIVKAVISNIIH